MSVKRKYKSDAFEAVHQSVNALLNVGAIDKQPCVTSMSLA